MRIWSLPHQTTAHFAFVVFDRFSNQVLSNAVEPLRAANTILGKTAYTWQLLSLDGYEVTSSAGMRVVPDGALSDASTGDALILLPSYGFRDIATPDLLSRLRRCTGRFSTLIGVDSGAWPLAAAGLLDGRRATIHFDVFDLFSEAFPSVHATRARWVDDGDRLTAAGAVTVFEMMTHLLAQRHGAALTLRIAALFAVPDPLASDPTDPPRVDRKMRSALAAMEANVEVPLSMPDVAQLAGCTQKSLERRFRDAFGAPPRAVYQRIRLDAARSMIEDTSLSITEIAARCGYGNASAFSRAFARQFGLTPRNVRALATPNP